MRTPVAEKRSDYREKGSKFIGILFRCDDRKAFSRNLEAIRREYPDATHHCYGWRINPAQVREFADDDGEPGGTAGPPILNQLKSFDAVNAGLVVVRYYGGTNLGKPGLIRAYGTAAALCLERADLARVQPTKELRISYPYPRQNAIDRLKATYRLKELNAEYLETVTLEVAVPVNKAADLTERLRQLEHLEIAWEELGTGFLVTDS